ncbi:zinc finger Y-chromosomal protein 1-like isoform X11 [Vanessa tameamea]|uniref:Zinc finger Y-chromosomal protein 1-like isoform X11 n=1 Tax=Vanessa tameamea TaxID=334116 RepID=A0A8B8HYP2_VANTA
MESISNEGMCRCCASEGTFKDFLTTYHWMGEEEIYADMLRDCFAITLYTSDDFNNGGICEVCITQLRNACNFKRQVQQTEEQFKKRVQNSVLKSSVIKLEMAGVDDGEHSDTNLSDEFSVTEFEVPIKEEKVEEKPKKRQAAKPSTSRAKKAKTEDGEPSAKRTRRKTNIHENTVRKRKGIIKLISKATPSLKVVIKKKLEVDKHLDNIREILLNSNATPIRCKGGIGYACSFCTEQFPEPADLKTHTIEIHDERTKSNFMKGITLDDFIVKLDITNLKCKLCDTNLENISDFLDHLKTKHDKRTGVNSHIIPFKFDSDVLRCSICSKQFNNFKVLMEHMNIHFGNHVCEVCGAGFVNKRTLRTHGYRHKTGIFSCSTCSKIFDTKVKRREHERAVHIHMHRRNKCGYCGERFTDYTKKNEHEVKIHGAKPIILSCNACEKIFDNQRSLTVHSKNYHLMERRNK